MILTKKYINEIFPAVIVDPGVVKSLSALAIINYNNDNFSN